MPLTPTQQADIQLAHALKPRYTKSIELLANALTAINKEKAQPLHGDLTMLLSRYHRELNWCNELIELESREH